MLFFVKQLEEILLNHEFGDKMKHIDIRLALAKDFDVISDPLRLKVILKNIFSNAVRFSKVRREVAWLRISALRVEESFQLIIEDNGEGIRKDLQDKIFDMFYRASENSKGSGLGLYIVKEMVEKMGGTISVNSVWGKGSQFIIDLPDYNYAQDMPKPSKKYKVDFCEKKCLTEGSIGVRIDP